MHRKDIRSPERFGYEVLGPIIGEFCLRLWATTSQMDGDIVLLFCARGGLRLQLAYDRFLSVSGVPSPAAPAPLMVSRLVALRSSLWRTVRDGAEEIGPSAASAVSYEFRGTTVADFARALTGGEPAPSDSRWREPVDAQGVSRLLSHPAGKPVVDVLAEQAELFERHLDRASAGCGHAVLVDTGLYGTTRQLLAEGMPDREFSSALIARSHRPGVMDGARRAVGLSVDAQGYSPLRRRTALLRYWHFVEWFLEPALPSVRRFEEIDGRPRSNLEVDGWHDQVDPHPGSPFEGVMRYLGDLPPNPGVRVTEDAATAWHRFQRAVVWPSLHDGVALAVGTRSHDFGHDGTWSERTPIRPLAALRGTSMWREGEIARTGTIWRVPLLAGIEAAYCLRQAKRMAEARLKL